MAKLSLPIGIAIISISSLILSADIFAHSEHDKSRFVASNGIDKERCDNVLRPCKTIAYAVSQANKGDKVLVGSGEFTITSSEELFFLKSALVPVFGGYNRFDHYQSQSPQSNVTTLYNIPTDMVDELRKNGFRVIADGKAFAKDKDLTLKLASYHQLSQSQSNEACVSGRADVFDCNNIDLLTHLPLSQMSSLPSAGNDIWGHVDLNTNNEFAIMGVNNGVIVVNVTTPTTPVEVGTVQGVNSSWRDVKVYQYFDENINLWQAYAYVTTEGSNGGVAIIDLNNLPNSISLVEKNNVVSTSHNVYITNVDHTLNITLPDQTASLQLIGANSKSGAFQSYSLANPKTLVNVIAKNFGSGYTHDGASLVIDDQRSVNDCGLTSGSCTVFIDFNEDVMKLWNITDPNNSTQLGTASYNDVAQNNKYVHSGWGTEDKQFILLHDEFDEQRGGLNSTVRIFSIADLNSPTQVGQWTGPTRAIDHNGFVRGNRYYMSNYERGLTVLDITDPATPTEVGFFDTFTPSNNASFNGAWGVYPFLPSGNILVSDINSGLYVLKDNTNASTKGMFGFENKSTQTAQGTSFDLTVQRNASNASTSAAVSYQVIQGSAKQDTDFTVASSTLTWAANDNADKTISIAIADDPTSTEIAESFFIRLYNPTDGATLGANNYNTINIDGLVDNGSGSFEFNQQTIAENVGEYIVNVNRMGSTKGSIAFGYQLTSGEAIIGSDMLDASGQISWADGENDTKEITLTIIDDTEEEESEIFTLTLSSVDDSNLGSNAEITFTIADDDQNTAPVVTLSEDFEVNTGQTQSLIAQTSDNENDAMTYRWEQTSGSEVVLTNADTLSASFTAPNSAESLMFQFTATDFRGASTTKSITISVIAPPLNTAPIVTLGANFELTGGQTQSLAAQARDAESDTMTYLWEQTAGSSVTLSNADTLITIFTAPNRAESLTFKFTATDSKGASTTDSITITVVASSPVVTSTPKKSSGGSIFWLTMLSLSLLIRKIVTIK
ncbi:choice-of-anchor B family protein [Colwellia hornerae]|uniref:Choice-of-anchor B family protein n=1 Tax=Colwellia hornerae TaxID=89402 RepID=A0A5C6QUR7_9GAMM|nr:choice-of-anchor B family protein [Colwellia hornerae]TWX57030.1 choice-of-anchor B family protein [Colwellia hornerae]TWX62245.1 choice-of-anchor B family protein [Colwellia hornerae]TWX72423.1 choice-of-anchor B family protein [Colwellia hornerae]